MKVKSRVCAENGLAYKLGQAGHCRKCFAAAILGGPIGHEKIAKVDYAHAAPSTGGL